MQVKEDKYATTAEWFRRVNDKKNYPLAAACCDIADCYDNIERYTKSNEMNKLEIIYEDLFNKLLYMSSDTNSGDSDVSMRIWQEVVDILGDHKNIKKFVSKKENEMRSLLQNIDEKCEAIGNSNPFQEENVTKLRKDIKEMLDKRIDAAKNNMPTDTSQ